MKARDVMTFPVITVRPEASVVEVAKTFVQSRISGAPVLDRDNKLVGMISEGDLVYRSEIGTERAHPYWYLEYAGKEHLAAEYVKARARKVADLMTPNVITASPEASLNEIANLLESNAIKRVPIVESGQVVGIVSRGNLLQALASVPAELAVEPSDRQIREALRWHLSNEHWADASRLNILVHHGQVKLWGRVNSDAEKRAIRVAAESMKGVRAVIDNLIVRPAATAEKPVRDITTR